MLKQSTKIKKALYAGSFNPVHEGHLDIIHKASSLFDLLYVVISQNPEKNNNDFKRNYNDLIQHTQQYENVIIMINSDKLTAKIAAELEVKYLVRSARNQMDYAFEIDLASGNKILNKDLETILIIPDHAYLKVSSALRRAMKDKNV
ncbi:phosphopantetheine adenylyltransferase [Mycoplasmopsis mustelae]|uniref:Pantetheine-phosphate adenylyltransferase n=1 Tax=Mycoplasmopsis mustelae TaxID=171289 RepID=A0A4R7UCM6_9BACT|nr:pantetheine-phosphate adenylyltransferase [Mycoplasmopsis mustelae]TDV24167.1 phosphopantetheine adenylyltransferase [Mycoplasmopsis mustelae]